MFSRLSLPAAVLVAVLAAVVVSGATAASTTSTIGRTAVVTDPSGDASDHGIDVVRVTFGRAPGGQLRASITTDDDFAPSDLRARTGPPGSICLDLWTVTAPGDTPPDYLVCVTANAQADALRATIMRERPDELPMLIGPASVTRSSERNATIRFGQSAIAKPPTIVFAVEASAPGCVAHISCVDRAPDAPSIATLKLRKPTTATG